MEPIYKFLRENRYELSGVAICIALALISTTIYFQEVYDLYDTLKQSFNVKPYSAYIVPLCIGFYCLLGFTVGKMIKLQSETRAIIIGIIVIVINMAWTPIFFVSEDIDIAFFWISLLLVMTIIFTNLIRKDKLLFYLTIPYLLWVIINWLVNLNLLILY